MSRNEVHPGNDLPKPRDTLDLHGFNKNEAIRRTTDFLDQSNTLSTSENAWVLLITGSGAHSQDGREFSSSVLKILCEKLLRRFLTTMIFFLKS